MEQTEIYATFLKRLDEARDFEITNLETLEEFRVMFLGAKGITKELFNLFKQVDANDRKSYGEFLRRFKEVNEEKYEGFKQIFS